MDAKRVGSLSVIIAAVAGLGMATSAQADPAVFQNWKDDVAGNWNVAANWNAFWGGDVHVPYATDAYDYINKGIVTIDTPDAVAGILSLGDTTYVDSAPGAGQLRLTTGGVLTMTNALNIGASVGASSSVVQDGGSVILPSNNARINVGQNGGVGTYTMSGGTITATSSNVYNGGISVNTAGSTFKQSGGTVSLNGAYLSVNTGGLYEISGGALSFMNGGYPSMKFDGAGTFRVKGSAATVSTDAGGGFSDSGGGTAVFEFRLDNSAKHISTMTSASGTFSRGGVNLKASLDGGVLLSNESQFTLIHSGWANGTWTSTPTGLWTTNTGDEALFNTNISLAAASNKGTLDASGTLAASFAASSYGYVDLANIAMSQPLDVLVDVKGGTIGTFTNALDAAGITWATATGDYNLKLTMDPAVSGGSHFAWDLGTIDPTMSIDRVSLVAVPEPASVAFLGALTLMGLGLRKRSQHR